MTYLDAWKKKHSISALQDRADSEKRSWQICWEPSFGKAWDASQIFDHLKIADSPEYHQYLNQYDIIYIDFSRLPENCTSYRQYINRIITGLKNDLAEAYPEYQTDSIYALWDILSQISEQTDQQFVFIMDEWDAVFHLPFITENGKMQSIYFFSKLC